MSLCSLQWPVLVAAEDQDESLVFPTPLLPASCSKLFNTLELSPEGHGVGVRLKSPRVTSGEEPSTGKTMGAQEESPRTANPVEEVGSWGSVDSGGSLQLPVLPEP